MKKFVIKYNGYHASDTARWKWRDHFSGDKYDTVHDAAEDIFKTFYNSIDEFGYPEAGIEFPEGIEDDEEASEAMSKMLDDVLKEIETSGRYENDGNSFTIDEVEVGELMAGDLTEDGTLTNLKPIFDGIAEREDDLYESEDAEHELYVHVRATSVNDDYEIEEKPWGWDVTTSDDDGNKSTMHVAWKAR